MLSRMMHCENDLVSRGGLHTPIRLPKDVKGSTSTLFCRDEVRRLVDLPRVLHHETTSAGLLNDDIITGLAKRFVHDGWGVTSTASNWSTGLLSLCAARVGRLAGWPSRLQEPGFRACSRLGVSSWNSRRFGAIILSLPFLSLCVPYHTVISILAHDGWTMPSRAPRLAA